jgi:hypothetical protein
MKPENLFIGNLNKCVKYNEILDFECGDSVLGHREIENELYERDVVLLKTKNGNYVDVRELNLFLQISLFLMPNGSVHYPMDYPYNAMLTTYPWRNGQLFVDKDSLVPYYSKDNDLKNVSIHKLKYSITKK